MRNLFLLLTLILSQQLKAQVFPVDTIFMSGPTDQRINFVYIGDGYTLEEQGKFIADVINMNEALFATVPFKEYRNYFNVFAIKVVSNQSGIKHANTAPDCPSGGSFQPTSNPDNYFGTRFDYGGIHRLVVPQNMARVNTVLANNFPTYDQVLIVANTSFYGGSGGTFATSTTNTSAPEIMIHEIGHSFAALADEYWAGIQYAAEKQNMTRESNPAVVKWKNWIGTPNIGVFPYSAGPGWYKPANTTCKMELLGRDFCNVCKEAFVKKIFSIVSPLQGFTPDNTAPLPIDSTLQFTLDLLVPAPNTLRRTWKLDGNQIAQGRDELVLSSAQLASGSLQLQATILDTTAFTRADNHASLYTTNVNWNLNVISNTMTTEVFTANLSIYPNPFSGQFILEYELDKDAALEIGLTSVDGRTTMLQSNRQVSAGAYQQQFNLNALGLSDGMYFLVFRVDNSLIAKELVKLSR
jgi:hypothetical protein